MNRKKKINQILKKKIKKQNSKLHSSNKPKYISKAEREKMELEAEQTEVSVDQEPKDQESSAS
ncbi:DUF2986 domain-containing protein [Vibrio inusitatus NBRC 102082]|uniref:DUF2986 domain-containing protein n=1 Tax=Vibrio inusitatus NBRC 102082 TaxID=1219070 RepID=A0A4Y3HVQ3_9VIBR|nr:DUF2986 domain-containing protein [Vibrio inusitatus]GEA50354.1 DUF2986 domain-containing protein [Vibrio inusitatus NBRC 102082]